MSDHITVDIQLTFTGPGPKMILAGILTKNRRKRLKKIAGNRSAFREFEAPANLGPTMPPVVRPTRNTLSV